MKATGLQTGRLGNQFAGLAGQIAGVHPVVGNLASVLGNFAVGGLVTVGVLGGVAAIAVAYDKLTESTRKAKEESDKLSASLERALHLKGLGPGGETVDQAANERAKAEALGIRIAKMEALIVKDALDADVLASNAIIQEKINKLVIERQSALNRLAGAQSIVNEKVKAAIDSTIPKVEKLKDTYMDLRDAAAKVNAESEKANKDFWRGYIEQTKAALTLTEQLNNAIMADRPTLVDAFRGLMTQGAPGTVDMPNISMPFEGLTEKQKENLRELGVIKEDANRNAQNVQDAIWGSASQLANTLVSALNIGGGGKGSNLGGAIGSTAGFALGFAFGGGPVGGAIGSLIGNIGGSFLGGLFDNKKATDINTAAIRANTAALLQNAPSVYKVARGRFDSTEIKQFRQGSIRYATRGGAPVMVVA